MSRSMASRIGPPTSATRASTLVRTYTPRKGGRGGRARPPHLGCLVGSQNGSGRRSPLSQQHRGARP
eukprot:9058716-Alexandrium_andersonii.AAC.1